MHGQAAMLHACKITDLDSDAHDDWKDTPDSSCAIILIDRNSGTMHASHEQILIIMPMFMHQQRVTDLLLSRTGSHS